MDAQKKEMSDRLKRIEGQIRGLQKMLEAERPCEDIITQLMAARAALDKVGVSIISQYVQECVRIQPGEAGADGAKSLERALTLFLRLQVFDGSDDKRRKRVEKSVGEVDRSDESSQSG